MTTRTKLYGMCRDKKCNNRFTVSPGFVPKYCGKCGTETITKCPNAKCGKSLEILNDINADFCEACGERLHKDS